MRSIATVAGYVLLTTLLGFGGTRAAAQPIADHLHCYKVKDAQPKASYTADLGGLAAHTGCLIKVPGNLLCVEAAKTNVSPAPQGGTDDSGAAGRFLCYKVKCPKVALAPLQWHDQFGDRQLTPSAQKIVCAPEIVATTTTTVASSTSTTTTTTSTTTTSTTTTSTTTTTLAPGSLCAQCTADTDCPNFIQPPFFLHPCVSFPQGQRCTKQCVIDADCPSPSNHCVNNQCVCTN